MVRQPHYKDHFSSGQVVVLIAEFYCTYINSGQAKNILYAGTGFFSVAYIEFYKTWLPVCICKRNICYHPNLNQLLAKHPTTVMHVYLNLFGSRKLIPKYSLSYPQAIKITFSLFSSKRMLFFSQILKVL